MQAYQHAEESPSAHHPGEEAKVQLQKPDSEACASEPAQKVPQRLFFGRVRRRCRFAIALPSFVSVVSFLRLGQAGTPFVSSRSFLAVRRMRASRVNAASTGGCKGVAREVIDRNSDRIEQTGSSSALRIRLSGKRET